MGEKLITPRESRGKQCNEVSMPKRITYYALLVAIFQTGIHYAQDHLTMPDET